MGTASSRSSDGGYGSAVAAWYLLHGDRRTVAATLPAAFLPVVVSLGVGFVMAPLASFVSYLSRAATMAHETVSVGPFVPPSERP